MGGDAERAVVVFGAVDQQKGGIEQNTSLSQGTVYLILSYIY
jgi:hypothetical protein